MAMKPGILILFLGLVGLLPLQAVHATEVREYYRSARMMGMGGAGVAGLDFHDAIFLNPAALAGNDRTEFQAVGVDASLSTEAITSYLGGGATLTDFSPATISTLLGGNYYAQAQLSSTLLLRNLGIGFIGDAQAALLTKNVAHPEVTLGYVNTYGFQASYGFSLLKRKKARGDLRMGFGAKLLYRRGNYREMGLLELLNLSASSLAEFTGGFEQGVGVDAGLQYVYAASRSVQLRVGIAAQNLGAVSFAGTAGPRYEQNLSAGFAVTASPRGLPTFTLTYDYRNILLPIDWRLRNNLGLELALPLLKLYGGVHQTGVTYGGGIDLGVFQFIVTSYSEELGAAAFQDPDRRWMARAALRLGL